MDKRIDRREVALYRELLIVRGPMFRKIVHDRTADTVISQIEDLVLDGVLRPGDRLPAERELSAELDVSRPILRAA